MLFIISLPGLIAGWFFWHGFRNDPALQAVAELVRRDGTAQAVLGDDIHITGVESRNFSFALGLFSENSYSVDLEGTRGAGVLDVRSHSDQSGVKIDSMRLTGPDGRRYDLMTHGLLPSAPGSMDDTI